MKNIVTILTFIVFQLNCFSQAPAIEWQKCLGGSDYEYGSDIEQTADGGYIIIGSSGSNDGDLSNTGYGGIWVVKLNAIHQIEWQRKYRALDGNSIKQTPDGGYIFAGNAASNNMDVTGIHGQSDYWIVKLNSTGLIEWQKALGGTNSEVPFSINLTNDSGYIVAGYSLSNDDDLTGNNGSYDYWIVKLTNDGDISWQKSLGGSNSEIARSIQQTSDGSFIVAGESNSNDVDVSGNNGNNDFWIVKLNPNGNIIWQKTLGGTYDDRAKSIQQTTDGGFIITGVTGSNDGDISFSNGNDDYWVVKLTMDGNLEWERAFGGNSWGEANCVKQTADGGYIVTGLTPEFSVGGYNDFWIIKLSVQGEILWQKSIGGTSIDQSYAIRQTSDYGYITIGISLSNDIDVAGNNGQSDIWVVKLAPDPLSNETFIQNNITVFPNPTNTTLKILLGSNQILNKITITDLTGKIIQEQTQNTNVVHVENLPSGIYIIHATSAESTYHSKFVKN